MIKGHNATVHYFVKVLGMDITQFNEVMLTHNFLFVYMFTVILGGVIVIIVGGWGYYSSMHYIYLSNTPLMDVHVLKYILDKCFQLL